MNSPKPLTIGPIVVFGSAAIAKPTGAPNSLDLCTTSFGEVPLEPVKNLAPKLRPFVVLGLTLIDHCSLL